MTAATLTSSLPFSWAEALICEQIIGAYAAPEDRDRRLVGVVSLHTRMWLSLLDDDASDARAKRKRLEALAVEIGLTTDDLDAANRAVLFELTSVIARRFRNSHRLRVQYAERLKAALQTIKAETTAEERKIVRLPLARAAISPVLPALQHAGTQAGAVSKPLATGVPLHQGTPWRHVLGFRSVAAAGAS